jgi:hypothetical protein
MYSWYPKQVSLFNMMVTLAERKDTSTYQDWKFKEYKYKFNSDYFASNLFGSLDYFSDTRFEGGQAFIFGIRAHVPKNVRPISDWLWRQTVKADAVTGFQRPQWQRSLNATLGLAVQYSYSRMNYSIKPNRDYLGVVDDARLSGKLDNSSREFFFSNHGISIVLDVSFAPNYVAIGAR